MAHLQAERLEESCTSRKDLDGDTPPQKDRNRDFR